MRNLLALPLSILALFAAAPLAAQKPGADEVGNSARDRYRAQGVSICVAELRTAEGMTPDDLEAICGCAFDRFLPGHDAATLPPPGPATLRSAQWPHLMSCAADREPRLSVAVARRLADSATASARTAPEPVRPPAALVPIPARPAQDKPVDQGGGLASWWAGLALPSWISNSGVTLWGWAIILTLAFMLLRALFRRRDGRGDLTGPPAHMRPGARSSHLPPRG